MDKVKLLFILFLIFEVIVVAFVLINNKMQADKMIDNCKAEFGDNYEIVREQTPFSSKIVCKMKNDMNMSLVWYG